MLTNGISSTHKLVTPIYTEISNHYKYFLKFAYYINKIRYSDQLFLWPRRLGL